MALSEQRIIHLDNGTPVDLSISLNDAFGETATIGLVAAEDYLVVGSDLPFNHRYFQVSTVNDQASVVSAEIWDGNSWAAAVDIIDYTTVGGVSLARSGYIKFTVDRNSSWAREDTTEDVTGLTSLKIYDKYWMRFKWSADLNASTALRYLGFKFADDSDIQAYYPDLMNATLLTAFAASKTDWNDQHFMVAEEIISHLQRKGIAWNRNQVVDWEQYNLAGIHGLAKIAYNAFGDDYKDDYAAALEKFNKSLNFKVHRIDRDADGKLDPVEKEPYVGLVRR